MKDLLTLYKFYSVHGTEDEKNICDWIEKRIKELTGFEDIHRVNNTLWRFKEGNKVLLSAHLDQVSTNGPAVHFFKNDKGIITAYNKDWERTSLGADDKNGVWLILKTLEACPDIDFIISEGEEVGCVGIKSIENHIKESTADFAIVLDRKGNTDILKGGGSDVYCESLAYNLKNFLNKEPYNSYIVTTGTLSDTRVICKYIESVNMCVNYEDAHSKTESTDYEALEITLSNLGSIIDFFIHYPAPPEDYCVKEYKSTYKSIVSSFNKKSKDYDDDYEWRKYYGGLY